MAPSAARRMPLRLRAADARVARLEALKRRTPPTHKFFGMICVLLRCALIIKMLVANAEGLQLSAGLLRPDYYYEDGLPAALHLRRAGAQAPRAVEGMVPGRHPQVSNGRCRPF